MDYFNLPEVDLLDTRRPKTDFTTEDTFLQDILKEGETNKLLQKKSVSSQMRGNFVNHPLPLKAWSPTNDNKKEQLAPIWSGFLAFTEPAALSLLDLKTQKSPPGNQNKKSVARRNPPRSHNPTPWTPPRIPHSARLCYAPQPMPRVLNTSPVFIPGVNPSHNYPPRLKRQEHIINYTANFGSFPPNTQGHVLRDHPWNYPDINPLMQHQRYSYGHLTGWNLANAHIRRDTEFTAALRSAPGPACSQRKTSSPNNSYNSNATTANALTQNPALFRTEVRRSAPQTQQASLVAKPSSCYSNSHPPSSHARAAGFGNNSLESSSNSNQNSQDNINGGATSGDTLVSTINLRDSTIHRGHTNHNGITNTIPIEKPNPSSLAKGASKFLNYTRGVLICNVPPTVTLSQVCSNIRGGAVEQITIEHTDTQTDIAVYFVIGDSAQAYKHFTNKVGGIYWTGPEHIGTFPSFTAFIGPRNGGHDHLKDNIQHAIRVEGATRCLFIRGLPEIIGEERLLRDIKAHLKAPKLVFESLETRVDRKIKDKQPTISVIFRFTSISTALGAKNVVTTNESYKDVQVSFVPDECARPLQELSERWKWELEQTHGIQDDRM